MFNKSYIKKAAAIAAVILAATALPVNMANADTQTTGSTVTGNTLTGIRIHRNPHSIRTCGGSKDSYR